MLTGRFNTPLPTNEPVYGYAPGSAERRIRSRAIARKANVVEIPCVVGGERIFTGRTVESRCLVTMDMFLPLHI